MNGNVFNHNATSSEAIGNFAPTPPPFPVSQPPPKAAPAALSVMYVIPYLLFLLFAIGMFAAARIFRFYDAYRRKNRGNEGQANEGSNHRRSSEHSRRSYSRHSTPRNSNVSIGDATVVALGMSDRIRIYRRTFDKNKHYHILGPKDFRHPRRQSNETISYVNDENVKINEDEEDIKSVCATTSDDDINSVNAIDEEDPSWIYLNLSPPESDNSDNDNESTPSPKKEKKNDDDKTTIRRDKDAIYSSHTCETIETITTATSTTMSEGGATVNQANPLTRVSGACIICFEEFKVGETVVWSDDTTKCRHVFHEDCMVRFLATHSKRTKRRHSRDPNNQHSAISYSYAENPCPICRRTFCTVKHDDLVMAVLLKSVAVALGEEEEDLPNFSRGGGEGSPFTSSERSQRIAATTYALASATIGNSASMLDRDSFQGEFSFDDIL